MSYSVKNCDMCGLWASRYKIVNGKGPTPCDVMLIGEAPGEQEDRKGEPFVGRAGSILNTALDLIDVKREDVYITNTIRCRPPRNRRPTKEEINMCRVHLDKEIAAVKPKRIVLMGKTATENFLPMMINGFSENVGTVHVMDFAHGPVALIVCFHPMYIGYNPSKLDDFEKALRIAFT